MWVSQGDDLMVDVHGLIGSQMAGLAGGGREATSRRRHEVAESEKNLGLRRK